MVLSPGESTGGPTNHHKNSDQWLFVLSGHGQATLDNKTIALNPNDLLLIAAGENHQIKNTGKKPLATLNLYAPPAY